MRTVRQYGDLLRDRGEPVRVRPGDRLAERSAENAALWAAALFMNVVRSYDPDARWAVKPEVRFGPVDKFTGRTVGWVGSIVSSWHQTPDGDFAQVLDPAYFAGSHDLGCPLIVECPGGGRAAHIGLGECDRCGECACDNTTPEPFAEMLAKATLDPVITSYLSHRPLLPPMTDEERVLDAVKRAEAIAVENTRRVTLMRHYLGSINVSERRLLDLYDAVAGDAHPYRADGIAYAESCDG